MSRSVSRRLCLLIAAVSVAFGTAIGATLKSGTTDIPKDWIKNGKLDRSALPDRIKVSSGPDSVGWIDSSAVFPPNGISDATVATDVYNVPVGGTVIGTFTGGGGFVPTGSKSSTHRTAVDTTIVG